MLGEMKILHDGKTALFEVNQTLLASTGGVLRDCKAALDEALSLKTVEVAVLVVELKRGGVKISLRSDGAIDVAHVMAHYGGGGHRIRAGAHMVHETMDEAVEAVMDLIKNIIKDSNETQS